MIILVGKEKHFPKSTAFYKRIATMQVPIQILFSKQQLHHQYYIQTFDKKNYYLLLKLSQNTLK